MCRHEEHDRQQRRRCGAAQSTTKRGQRGVLKRRTSSDAERDGGGQQQQRDGARGAGQIPVRRCGPTRPAIAGHCRRSVPAAGQSPIVHDPPVPAHKPRRQAQPGQPRGRRARRGRARPWWRCSRRCSSAAATLTVRQVPRAGAPVAGSMMWCMVCTAVIPAAHGGAGGGQAAGVDRDRLAGRARSRCGDRRSRARASRRAGAGRRSRCLRRCRPERRSRRSQRGRARRGRRPTLWRSRRGRA